MTATASALLAACAGVPESLTEAEAERAAPSSAATNAPESVQIAGIIELRPRLGEEVEEPECRRDTMTGSRIIRMRCSKPRSDLEERLDDEYARSQLELAREMALLEERRRMEQAAEEQLRQQEMQQRAMEMMRR